MTAARIHRSAAETWRFHAPQRTDAERIRIHGRVLPMEQPRGWLGRVFGGRK